MKILVLDPNDSLATTLSKMDLPNSTLNHHITPPPISDKSINLAQFIITMAESVRIDPQHLQEMKQKQEKLICRHQEIKMIVSDTNVIIAHTSVKLTDYDISDFYIDAATGLMLLNTKFIVISDDMDRAQLHHGPTAKNFALKNDLPYWQTDGDIQDLVALITA